MLVLESQNVILNVAAATREEVIKILVDRLGENGYVTPAYLGDVLDRENRYPTGLPTEGVPVSIPHGMTSEGVIAPAVGIAILASPVPFCCMGCETEELQVEIVFLIANKNPEAQLQDLRQLMKCFGSRKLLNSIRAAGSPDVVIDLLKNYNEDDEDEE